MAFTRAPERPLQPLIPQNSVIEDVPLGANNQWLCEQFFLGRTGLNDYVTAALNRKFGMAATKRILLGYAAGESRPKLARLVSFAPSYRWSIAQHDANRIRTADVQTPIEKNSVSSVKLTSVSGVHIAIMCGGWTVIAGDTVRYRLNGNLGKLGRIKSYRWMCVQLLDQKTIAPVPYQAAQIHGKAHVSAATGTGDNHSEFEVRLPSSGYEKGYLIACALDIERNGVLESTLITCKQDVTTLSNEVDRALKASEEAEKVLGELAEKSWPSDQGIGLTLRRPGQSQQGAITCLGDNPVVVSNWRDERRKATYADLRAQAEGAVAESQLGDKLFHTTRKNRYVVNINQSKQKWWHFGKWWVILERQGQPYLPEAGIAEFYSQYKRVKIPDHEVNGLQYKNQWGYEVHQGADKQIDFPLAAAATHRILYLACDDRWQVREAHQFVQTVTTRAQEVVDDVTINPFFKYRENVRRELAEIDPNQRTEVKGVHLSRWTGEWIPVNLVYGPARDGGGIRLVDRTFGKPVIKYGGATESAAFADFEKRCQNGYPTGQIKLKIRGQSERTIATYGKTTQRKVSEGLGVASAGTLAVGLGLTLSVGGTPAGLTVLIGAALGAASGALDLDEAFKEAELSHTRVALDALEIVTCLFAATRIGKLYRLNRTMSTSRASQYLAAKSEWQTLYAMQVGVKGAYTVIFNFKIYQAIEEIIDSQLAPSEKIERITKLVLLAAAQDALLLLGLKNAPRGQASYAPPKPQLRALPRRVDGRAFFREPTDQEIALGIYGRSKPRVTLPDPVVPKPVPYMSTLPAMPEVPPVWLDRHHVPAGSGMNIDLDAGKAWNPKPQELKKLQSLAPIALQDNEYVIFLRNTSGAIIGYYIYNSEKGESAFYHLPMQTSRATSLQGTQSSIKSADTSSGHTGSLRRRTTDDDNFDLTDRKITVTGPQPAKGEMRLWPKKNRTAASSSERGDAERNSAAAVAVETNGEAPQRIVARAIELLGDVSQRYHSPISITPYTLILTHQQSEGELRDESQPLWRVAVVLPDPHRNQVFWIDLNGRASENYMSSGDLVAGHDALPARLRSVKNVPIATARLIAQNYVASPGSMPFEIEIEPVLLVSDSGTTRYWLANSHEEGPKVFDQFGRLTGCTPDAQNLIRTPVRVIRGAEPDEVFRSVLAWAIRRANSRSGNEKAYDLITVTIDPATYVDITGRQYLWAARPVNESSPKNKPEPALFFSNGRLFEPTSNAGWIDEQGDDNAPSYVAPPKKRDIGFPTKNVNEPEHKVEIVKGAEPDVVYRAIEAWVTTNVQEPATISAVPVTLLSLDGGRLFAWALHVEYVNPLSGFVAGLTNSPHPYFSAEGNLVVWSTPSALGWIDTAGVNHAPVTTQSPPTDSVGFVFRQWRGRSATLVSANTPTEDAPLGSEGVVHINYANSTLSFVPANATYIGLERAWQAQRQTETSTLAGKLLREQVKAIGSKNIKQISILYLQDFTTLLALRGTPETQLPMEFQKTELGSRIQCGILEAGFVIDRVTLGKTSVSPDRLIDRTKIGDILDRMHGHEREWATNSELLRSAGADRTDTVYSSISIIFHVTPRKLK